jgi:predicted dehydrogenase
VNVVVIGLGSMGKRRIRLLHEMYPDYKIYGVGRREEKRNEVNSLFGIDSFESIQAVNIPIDCAFVCTSPLSHSGIITDCLKRHWNVFTELNLVDDGYEDNIALAASENRTLFISSTFLYREETRYIRSKIAEDKRWNYVYHIGQYLPDWHPWENYKDYFVGDSRTNGCREIMAIELPWLIKSFGSIIATHTITDKMTALEVPYKDNFLIQISHEKGNKGILVVDVVSPVAVRKLEAYSEGSYISWGGTPESLYEYVPEKDALEQVRLCEDTEHKDGYRAFIVENAYKNEIREFFEVVQGSKEPEYDFRQDLITLKIIGDIGA